MAKFWLRAENKPLERRRALSPSNAKKLQERGHTVFVEKSQQSIFDDSEYKENGCKLVAEGSWPEADKDFYIFGLKELPLDTIPIKHNHIYFAHAYKNQDGWKELLARFVEGGGKLFDLEYLTHDNGARVAAFGYWAGFAGAAMSSLIYYWNLSPHDHDFECPSHFNSSKELIDYVQSKADGKNNINSLIIGSNGRSGTGASDFFNTLEIQHEDWDREQTTDGGPFKKIMDFDIFINCVLMTSKNIPFLNKDIIKHDGSLKVIGDISCDPTGPYNSLPIYSRCTTFDDPYINVRDENNPLYLMAIDNLPSLLPRESSEDYSLQLLEYLDQIDKKSTPWKMALTTFEEAVTRL